MLILKIILSHYSFFALKMFYLEIAINAVQQKAETEKPGKSRYLSKS